MGLVPSNKEKFREEISKVKSLKGAKRWEYIWEYYKFFIIGLLILMLVGGGSLYNAIVNPPPTAVLNVAWVYGPQLLDFFDDLGDELTRSVTEPSQNERVDVYSFAESGDPQLDAHLLVRYAAMVTSAELDIMIATREMIVMSAEDGMLLDISSWLPRDMESVVRLDGIRGFSPVYAVSILDSRILEEVSFFMSEDCPPPYVGVFINSESLEKARQAIEVLLD